MSSLFFKTCTIYFDKNPAGRKNGQRGVFWGGLCTKTQILVRLQSTRSMQTSRITALMPQVMG